MISTLLTSLLRIDHPYCWPRWAIWPGGRLASAVSSAGGLGLLGGGYTDPAWLATELEIAADARIGVGLITFALDACAATLQLALEAKPVAVELSFGDPRPHANAIHGAGALLICQVQSSRDVDLAVAASADVIVGQGQDAVGHGRRARATLGLVPSLVDRAAARARAKVILVGDDRQLGPVGHGGSLTAIQERVPNAVHVLDENVRQIDPAERGALDELRSGDLDVAVRWYADNGRVSVHPVADEALDAVGDLVVTTAPGPDGLVTSTRADVSAVDPERDLLTITTGSDSYQLSAGQSGPDRLTHGYATTIHRAQGLTVDTAHWLHDGGGRELACVAMSRSRIRATVYLVSDDQAQAAADLHHDWRREERPRWALDLARESSVADGLERSIELH